MSHYKFVLFIAFFLLPFVFFCQTDFEIQDDYILFEDAATGEPVLVYNDSMAVRGFDFKKHFKISFPDGLKPEYFTDNHYQIGDSTYLVDNGCGAVLQFVDNTFKRIDNSFRHRNQFNGVPFVKDSMMYLFGGYGLFTFKDILTKYDFKKGEWDIVQTINNNDIPPISNTFYLQLDNIVYVFGGHVEVSENKIKRKLAENKLWKLNLDNFEWSIMGEHDLDNYYRNLGFNNIKQIDVGDKIVLLKFDINEIDIKNNLIKKYNFKNYKSFLRFIYHKKTKYVSYVYESAHNKLIVTSEPYEALRGDVISITPFYKETNASVKSKVVYGTLTLFLIVSLLFVFLHEKISKPQLIFSGQIIFYESQNEVFSYMGKEIKIINPYKKALLKYFMENNDSYILLNDLNDLITIKRNQIENFSTIQKRREMLLNELKKELSIVMDIDEDEVFSFRKNKYDKRLKEIKLEVRIQEKQT